MNIAVDVEPAPGAAAAMLGLRPDGWRGHLLTHMLRVMVVLGAIVCVPSVWLSLRSGLPLIAVGDTLALLTLVALLFGDRLEYRIRAGALGAVLYLLGAMLLVSVGPVSQIYLLGFSVMTTMLLGLRAGVVTLAVNALTLAVFGYIGLTTPAFVPPDWVGNALGWAIVSANFLLVNAALVVAIGVVLSTLERGIARESASNDSLRQSEAILRMASRLGRLGAWSVDTSSARALTGSDGSQVIDGVVGSATVQEALRFCVDEDRPKIRDAFLQCAANGLPFDLEFETRVPDGPSRRFRVIGEAIRDEAGNVVRVQGAFQDISEEARARLALAERAEVLDKAQDAITVRDLDGHVTFMNARAVALYGWDRDSALGADVRSMQFQDDAETFDQANAATIRDGSFTGELSQQTQDGRSVLIEGHWTLLRRTNGEPYGVLAINTDITERRRLERHLRAQRLESIGSLAGGIAHDLNNVLTPILSSLELLKDGEENPDRQEDLAILESSALHGAEMVRQLLLFARGGDEGSPVAVHLPRVASETLKMVRDTFPRSVVVTMAAPPRVHPVRADPTQIRQLLTNLCINARDAMPQGGTLNLGIEEVAVDEVAAAMTVGSVPGTYVRVRVEDTGTGMSKEVQDRIFEPFFTTKEVGQGTGLGLSTCHTIVRTLGGFIHVYSEIGKGTRFDVYLPADLAGEQAEAARAPSALPRGQGETILVVDDEESVRHLTTRTLEWYGYRVLTAANGAEAVATLVKHPGLVTVVFTDLSMPIMDGPATIAALRAIDPRVKIVASSGLDNNNMVAKALGAGVEHFVPKPYTAEALLQMLRQVITEDAGSAAA